MVRTISLDACRAFSFAGRKGGAPHGAERAIGARPAGPYSSSSSLTHLLEVLGGIVFPYKLPRRLPAFLVVWRGQPETEAALVDLKGLAAQPSPSTSRQHSGQRRV